MRSPKIVLVAEWDGWCGACADDRPLVLTRTGRQPLRTWLAGAADDSRPLVLTCRLCGTGVDVPLERDDPPIVVTAAADARPEAGEEPSGPVLESVPAVPESLPAVPSPVSAEELAAGRGAVAQVLGALLRQRTTTTTPHVVAPAVAPALAPPVPLQRTATGGTLTELQLLADGIDLLTTRRS